MQPSLGSSRRSSLAAAAVLWVAAAYCPQDDKVDFNYRWTGTRTATSLACLRVALKGDRTTAEDSSDCNLVNWMNSHDWQERQVINHCDDSSFVGLIETLFSKFVVFFSFSWVWSRKLTAFLNLKRWISEKVSRVCFTTSAPYWHGSSQPIVSALIDRTCDLCRVSQRSNSKTLSIVACITQLIV